MNLGIQSELKLIIECFKRGLNVSKPHTDFTGYDLIVEGKSKKLYKVQVKSTRQKTINTRSKAYKFNLARGANQKKAYGKKEVDFFALYIFEVDKWYFIPNPEVTGINARVYPNKNDHKFSKYYEAWHLFV